MAEAAENSNVKLLEVVKKQEEALQLDRFDAEDAWRLGLILRDLGLAAGKDLSLRVSLLGAQAFHCGIGRPKPNFDHWIARKEKGVLECWKSSLRLKLEALTGGDQPEDHGFSAAEVVFCGGCFPLRVKSQGVVGAVTVSGLTDLEDHQLAADALAEFLGVKAPGIPLK